MAKSAIKTDRDYADWKRKNEEREQRLLAEDLPWESDEPKEREQWEVQFKDSRIHAAALRADRLNANAKQLAEAGVENAISGDTFTLSKEQPLVNMISASWGVNPKWDAAGPSFAKAFKISKIIQLDTPPELIVQGLGEYAGKRRARLAPVEMTAFDLSNRILERLGITDDDKLPLPDKAARVLFVLKDLKREGVTVTLNRENAQHRGDGPTPRNWLVHKRWTEPKGAYE